MNARIKAGGAPCSEPMISFERPLSSLSVTFERPASVSSATHPEVRPTGEPNVHYAAELTSPSNEDFDLGKILAGHGYIPQAVYLASVNEVRAFAAHAPNVNRTNGNRLRANGHPNYYRGAYRNRENHQTQQTNDIGHYREYIRREYSNTNYRNHHNNSRRGNNNNEANYESSREKNAEFQPRNRFNRQNNFISQKSGVSAHSRHAADNQKSGFTNNRNRNTGDYEQKQKQTLIIEPSGGRMKRSSALQRANRSPVEEKEYLEDYNLSSPCNDDSKSESSSKKTEEPEYNFEENAFPSLSEDVKEEIVKEEKPLFSKVAAGKKKERKESKEKRSYAQMLKQGNGLSANSSKNLRKLSPVFSGQLNTKAEMAGFDDCESGGWLRFAVLYICG
ncbi:unnamed protein product [Enterobius vermicularis]|uniref:ZM domain-containing protein n=1 Tax=Enterobius vermicularis TaxID=51028 RepID=A0A0N4V9I4_ENTVE|nr:unnamed protein product [Enterobius vermicularis]